MGVHGPGFGVSADAAAEADSVAAVLTRNLRRVGRMVIVLGVLFLPEQLLRQKI
jgi:hypothetical protein